MNFFSIKITDSILQNIYCLTSCLGEIDINNEIEKIVIPLEWWSIQDYERQWKEGLERLKTNNESCIITSIQNLYYNPLIDWYLFYKENNKIYIINTLIKDYEFRKLASKLPEFNIETCYNYIPKKNTIPEADIEYKFTFDLDKKIFLDE